MGNECGMGKKNQTTVMLKDEGSLANKSMQRNTIPSMFRFTPFFCHFLFCLHKHFDSIFLFFFSSFFTNFSLVFVDISYEIKNGLLGLKRDVLFHVFVVESRKCMGIKEKDRHVRAVFLFTFHSIFFFFFINSGDWNR
jgi:hypothetical protein